MVSPMYEADQVERLSWLTNNGYDFRNPNSVQSQMALTAWNQRQEVQTTGGGKKATMSGTTTTDPIVTNTTYSGIADTSVRDDLINKALSTPVDNSARNAALDQVNKLLQSFSPSAAQADTDALMSRSMQKAAEAFMPGMTRGMQAAGQSGSSMQALMSQRAASDAAYNAAALAADNKGQYGNVASSLAGVLENLTKADYGQQQLALSAADLLKTSTSTPNVTTGSSSMAPVSNGIGGLGGLGGTGGSGMTGSSIPVTTFPGQKKTTTATNTRAAPTNRYTLVK